MDDMKKRLKEMEEEVAALHEMQAKVESHLDSAQGFLFCFFFFLGGFNFTMSKIMIFIPLIKFLLKLITNIENVKD